MENKLDQFYTNPHESDFFVKKSKEVFERLGYDKIQWIEPSAGSANFLISLKKIYGKKISYTAFDLDPQNSDFNIVKKDYLEVDFDDIFFTKKESITIGNPPFGKRAKLAISFFNKSAEFSDTIAMIFPLQFRKWSVHSKLNSEFKLIKDWDVPKGSFLVNNQEYDVNTCFQIWTRRDSKYKNKRIISSPDLSHKDFEIFIHNNTIQTQKYFDKKKYKWEFAVHRQGYYDYKKRIISEEYIWKNSNKQWIFVKPKNAEISKRLKSLDYEKLSKMNTTIPGFGKADLIKEYKRKYE